MRCQSVMASGMTQAGFRRDSQSTKRGKLPPREGSSFHSSPPPAPPTPIPFSYSGDGDEGTEAGLPAGHSCPERALRSGKSAGPATKRHKQFPHLVSRRAQLSRLLVQTARTLAQASAQIAGPTVTIYVTSRRIIKEATHCL